MSIAEIRFPFPSLSSNSPGNPAIAIDTPCTILQWLLFRREAEHGRTTPLPFASGKQRT
jgi:hypothetical protein